LVLPVALIVLTALVPWLGYWVLFAWLIYPAQMVRLALRGPGSGAARRARAIFQVLGKFAEAMGQLRFVAHRLSGRQGRLIEYK
jgi:hypothetical protein